MAQIGAPLPAHQGLDLARRPRSLQNLKRGEGTIRKADTSTYVIASSPVPQIRNRTL
jgi:hypothetical protein